MSHLTQAVRMDSAEVSKYSKRPTTAKARQEKRQAKIQAVFDAERGRSK